MKQKSKREENIKQEQERRSWRKKRGLGGLEKEEEELEEEEKERTPQSGKGCSDTQLQKFISIAPGP